MKSLYTEANWIAFCKKTEEQYELKKYPHLDVYFDFPKRKYEIKDLVSDASLKKVSTHSFLPFLKVLKSTPRYKWHEDDSLVDGGEYYLDTKIRPICFASHFDTYIYSFYSFVLNIQYQEYLEKNTLNDVVLAYRTNLNGKCNIQFAKDTFDLVKSKILKRGNCAAIALDIKGYFDHIDHDLLKRMWCKIIDEKELPIDQYKIFKSLTKYSYINYVSFLNHFDIDLKKNKREKKRFQSILDLFENPAGGKDFKSKMNFIRDKKLITQNTIHEHKKERRRKLCGIPQGSAMSAVLSNIYLVEFDLAVYEKSKVEDFEYRRYCDDILVICKPEDVNRIKNFLIKKIDDDCKLTIQDKKTDVIDFKKSIAGKVRSYKREYNKVTKDFDPLPNEDINFSNLQYLGFEFNGQNIYIRPTSLSRYFRKMKARIIKTVIMAYGKKSKSSVIFKKQILSRYSHVGKRNFLTYAYNSSKKTYSNSRGEIKYGMDSPSIRKQLRDHLEIINVEIQKAIGQLSDRSIKSKKLRF
ncbi:MAG: hypothetical protein BGN92_05430 [Sphingobacteriales bacterium 41-5]|nr:MAG: hypothetical protein BGN92_05430 [Sphingobacteriales bacterium 41-5]